MPLQGWRRITTRIRDANPWWEYRCDEVELPTGARGEFHYIETPGSVMVVARAEDGRFCLVEQYRYPNDRTSLEFPGGGVKTGDGVEGSARRELAEEAGYSAASLMELGSFNPCNGLTSEMCHVFLAEGLAPVSVRRDPTEEFTVRLYEREEIESLIRNGDLWDGMTLAAWMMYTRRVP